MVARIEKVLQGSISVPVLNHTSWLKSGATKKASQKANKLAEISAARAWDNNYYGTPFGWTARPLFNTEGELDSSEISSNEFTNRTEKNFLMMK